MTTTSDVCRGCEQPECEDLGSLPKSDFFAGIQLPTPLAGGRLYLCRHCRLVFRAPVLSAEDYSALYARASAELWATRPDLLRTDQTLVKDFIESRLPAGGMVLDVGCYTGEFLTALAPRFEKFGVEKSERAALVCRQAGIQVIADDLYAIDGMDERFDVIVAMDVVEHTLSPDAFIKALIGLLKHDGIIVITTGNADNPVWRQVKGAFWYCSYPEHISFISPSWLRLNALKNHYGIDHLSTFDYVRPSFLKRMAQKALIQLCSVSGRRVKASWTAHISKDHLLAALSPLRT